MNASVQAFKDYYKPMNPRALEGFGTEIDQARASGWVGCFDEFAYWDHGWWGWDGSSFTKITLVFQGQSFPGAEDLLARLEKAGYQLYGAMNGVTAIQEGRLAHSVLLISKRSLSLNSFILRNQNLHFLTSYWQFQSFMRKDPHDRRFFDGGGYRRRKCCRDWYRLV